MAVLLLQLKELSQARHFWLSWRGFALSYAGRVRLRGIWRQNHWALGLNWPSEVSLNTAVGQHGVSSWCLSLEARDKVGVLRLLPAPLLDVARNRDLQGRVRLFILLRGAILARALMSLLFDQLGLGLKTLLQSNGRLSGSLFCSV